MAYVRKIIAPEEKLIGIARLHWIYVIKGLVWFIMLAVTGWVASSVISQGAFMLADFSNTETAPLVLLNLADGAFFMLAGTGLFVFFLLVIKVLVTEVGLSSRRVILKEGLLFVKVKEIDVEEIRGENIDYGHLGSILGYGYFTLDCRFIGDVKLPAIENPEGFLNALHSVRSKTQDALAIVVGKGEKTMVSSAKAPVEGVDAPLVRAQEPPRPEIQPGQQPRQPEVPTRPTPHNPPPPTAPPSEPERAPPQPTQPIPAPINPEPPLQPPSGVDSAAVAQAMEQVMPHVVQEVVKQMAEQGLLDKEHANDDADDIDTDLISSFDEAREEESEHELHHKVEHAIH